MSSLHFPISVSELCQKMIQEGSKSFSLASFFLKSSVKEAAFLLYGWCRFCDDQIDLACTTLQAQKNFQILFDQTHNALRNPCSCSDPLFEGWGQVIQFYQIPWDYPLQLLEGLKKDAWGMEIHTEEDLTEYCYQVAGTVGLMMSHILGVREEKALGYARDLGMGMQLTNIARDLYEDALVNRCYIPTQWLHDIGMTRQQIGEEKYGFQCVLVVQRLLKKADNYYQSGYQGIQFLSFFSSASILFAYHLYHSIGKKVLKRQENAWNSRTFLTRIEKILVFFKSFFLWISFIPEHIRHPFYPVKLNKVWRKSDE